MDRFVVGYAFDASKDSVLLVRKQRPEWQRGYLNGIGGSIEPDETSLDAMIRECKEETGLSLHWKYRGYMHGKNDDGNLFSCGIFYAYDSAIFCFEQLEDEPLEIRSPLDLGDAYVENVPFLIHFGMYSKQHVFMSLSY